MVGVNLGPSNPLTRRKGHAMSPDQVKPLTLSPRAETFLRGETSDVLITRNGQSMFVKTVKPGDIIDEGQQKLYRAIADGTFRIKGVSEYQAWSTAHGSTREQAEQIKAVAERIAKNLPKGQIGIVDGFKVYRSGSHNFALSYSAAQTVKQREKFWRAVYGELYPLDVSREPRVNIAPREPVTVLK